MELGTSGESMPDRILLVLILGSTLPGAEHCLGKLERYRITREGHPETLSKAPSQTSGGPLEG